MNSIPIVRDVLLVGGGHSHVLLIRQWAMQALPGVRLTLVSTSSQTPYSGMLPGLIAGHYSVDEIHVDLRTLCSWAGVRFVENSIVDIDLDSHAVLFEDRPPMGFDVLSLDTGSTPDLSVSGAAEYATPVKPVYDFHSRWKLILERMQNNELSDFTIGVVGSGAGGFELVTAMRHALPDSIAKCQWFLRGELPLRGRPKKVGALALQSAKEQGIDVISNVDIVEVNQGQLKSADGRSFELDEILWCTSAVGPGWAKRAGFELDTRGFIATNEYLQSVSHPFCFATGDIGTQVPTPSVKAGVFAVRQAPFLYENIRRYLLQKPLKQYKPQTDFLSLMATGGKRAIASRGPFAIEANWVWRWKDYIDREFMNRFTKLPAMKTPSEEHLPEAFAQVQDELLSNNAMQCKGCGAKVSGSTLDKVLASIDVRHSPDVLSGVAQGADTAVVTVPHRTLVQSVDHLNAIVDDPYVLGKIAALHALSDVVTVNAEPHSAQVLVSVPIAVEGIVERDLYQLMSGISHVLDQEGCMLIGGHTTQGSELSVGLVVNATQNDQAAAVSNGSPSLEDGDSVVLTQGIGTGVLFAGLMQQMTCGDDIAVALQEMQSSNRAAANILRNAGAKVITDVTGFGLAGHLQRMMRNTSGEYGVELELNSIPLLPGAQLLAERGVRSSLYSANSHSTEAMLIDDGIDKNILSLLYDPQTSGGLLAIVPKDAAADIVEALYSAGFARAAAIGKLNKTGCYSIK